VTVSHGTVDGQRDPAPPPARLAVAHLTKSYGSRSRPAARDVSFDLPAGITGLLGPNGAGKSTVMRCAAGLASWDSGEVRIDGVSLARRPGEARRRLGYMPERVAFPNEMRVAEYLRFVAGVKGLPRSQRAGAVDGALGQAGLDGAAGRIVGNLSKGYRQRVGLAQALLGDAGVLILDEPSAGLDPLNVMDMRDTLRDCAADRAVLVSTHLLPEARLLCDRVIVMSQGRIVYDGSTAGMVGAGDGGTSVRIRLSGDPGRIPVVSTPGAALLHEERHSTGHVIHVATAGDAVIGSLSRELVEAGWSVIGLEPTTDALEAAFRNAVTGRADEEQP
jgi:ABC-2 type transport system ATP-binding protein